MPEGTGSSSERAPVTRIGRDHSWIGVALVGICVAFAIVTAALRELEALSATIYAVTISLSGAYVIVAHRHQTVMIDDRGLTVETARGDTTYLWADLLEVAWVGSLLPNHGPGLVVRLRGGPWDIPGPNVPAQVATLPVFGREGHRRAKEALRQACHKHGVLFAESGHRMLMDAPPGSPYRRAD